jgi:hypothetical protein
LSGNVSLKKKGLLQAMALVLRHTLGEAGFPANCQLPTANWQLATGNWQLPHNRILAISCLIGTINRQPVLHYS